MTSSAGAAIPMICAHEDITETADGDLGYGWHILCNECDHHFDYSMELI